MTDNGVCRIKLPTSKDALHSISSEAKRASRKGYTAYSQGGTLWDPVLRLAIFINAFYFYIYIV
jgi:hypothetical protein